MDQVEVQVILNPLQLKSKEYLNQFLVSGIYKKRKKIKLVFYYGIRGWVGLSKNNLLGIGNFFEVPSKKLSSSIQVKVAFSQECKIDVFTV